MEKTVERAAVRFRFFPAVLASCSLSLTSTSFDDVDAMHISDFLT